MNNIISIGPFLIKYTLIVTIIGGLIGYLFLSVQIKKMNMDKRLITDIVLGALIVYLIIWKFGDLLFNPNILWTSPQSIFYLNGSEKTTTIGIVFSVLYLFYKIKRHDIGSYQFMDLLPYGVLPFLLLYNLAVPSYGNKTNLPWGISISDATVNYHPLNYYLVIITSCLLILLKMGKGNFKTGLHFSKTAIVLGATGVLLSYLAPLDIKIIGLSYGQLFSIVLLLTGFTITNKVRSPVENGSK